MAVDRLGVSLDLVHDVDLFLVSEEHLWSREQRPWPKEQTELTIIALTRVSPASTMEPAVSARAGEAMARARREEERMMGTNAQRGVVN